MTKYAKIGYNNLKNGTWKFEVPVKTIKHNVMKTYVGSGGTATLFMASAVDGGEPLASCPCHFSPGKEPSSPY
jgi:hypothetical protein